MDWSNETYVRLYVRNTTTWRRLGFEGQTMLMHLLRVVDRAGVLDIEDMAPAEAAALHTGAPEDFAERGVTRLLELRTIRHETRRLVFPNFIEAQEAKKSDKQRQRESREKRNRDQSSQIVTDCHDNGSGVTVGHTESQPVTLSSAQLSSAQQSAAQEPSARDELEPIPIRKPARPLEPLEERVRVDFEKRFVSTAGTFPNQRKVAAMSVDLAAWIARVAEHRKMAEVDVLARLLDGFFASENASEAGYPPGFLQSNPTEYFEREKRGKQAATQAQPSAALSAVLKQLADTRARMQSADPDSWERTQAQNAIAELEGRAAKLRAS